jgi:lipoprotein-anchoring transpeptidase ErfK/SrfK
MSHRCAATHRAATRLTGLIAALSFLAIVAGCSYQRPKLRPAGPTSATASVATTSTTAAAPTTLAPGTSLVAEAVVPSVAIYPAPGAATPTQSLANPTSDHHGPLVFLVEENPGNGWIHVDLPVRPNGSTGWIRADQVELHTNPYRLVVSEGAHLLTVYKDDAVIMTMPVGIGTSDTPTPGGRYYLKELLEPPDPNGAYGPYAYGLSGFSNVLQSFEGGPGVIGLHGTNQPDLIGKSVSHGCIRLRNADIEKLVPILPLGTPVEITT